MIDFYLNHLNLSSSDLQKVNLTDDFHNEGKKIIYVFKPINKCSFFQKRIHKLRKEINDDQYLIFRFQTLKGRIRRIEKKRPRFLAKTQVGLEFLVFRLIPRLIIFRKIYAYLSKETILILSKAEGLGRIVFSGFDIDRVESSVSYSYVLASPSDKNYSSKKPSFGPIYGMPRIGKNGKIITVFKIRTMHPYSEFLHEYIKMKKSNPYTTDFILFFRALTNIIAFNKRGT